MNNSAVDEFFPPERGEFLDKGQEDPSVPKDDDDCDNRHDNDCDKDCRRR